MKRNTMKNIILSALIGSLLVFGASCSKKITPPINESATSGGLSAGNNINYPPAEYTENSIEGTLDDNSVQQISPDMVVDANTDPTSREYLIEHGRSTENLLPIADWSKYTHRR